MIKGGLFALCDLNFLRILKIMEMTEKIEAVSLEDYIKGLSWQKLERGWEGTKLRFTIRPTVNTVCYNDTEGDSDILLGMPTKNLVLMVRLGGMVTSPA